MPNKNMSKKEGRLVRTLDPMHYVGIYLMKDRNDSTNYFSGTFDIGAAKEYIKNKREQGYKDFSIMHLILAAIVRMYSQHPEMNRFIRGLKIYARNDIELVMTIKKEMKLNVDDTVIKLNFAPASTALEVYEETNRVIAEALAQTTEFDGAMKFMRRIPRCVMRLVAFFLRKLDFYGLLPRQFVHDVSPFHGSMAVTSLASLGIPPVYHHLYNFGNIPIFFAFGRRYNKYEITKDGTPEKHSYMDYTVTCDERIADGYAYSVALRYINSIMRNPSVLDTPPEKVVEDIP